MNISAARLEMQRARVDFFLARIRYLMAAKRVESLVYRKGDPALTRKQA